MTIDEEEGEKVMTTLNSVFDEDDCNTYKLSQNKDGLKTLNEDKVRSKMEAMQKRIDELKEKVKYEGDLLCKETVFSQDIIDCKSLDSLSDIKSKDSLSQDSKDFEDKIRENEEHSDKSLYFSASSYSMCSMSSNSSDATFCSFTKFVNNYMKNQDHKERLSLLQLHSKKQISLNMMKTSLLELEKKCSEELKVVERSLKHLSKLAEELKADEGQPEGDTKNYKHKALDLNGSGDSGLWKPITKSSLEWVPVREGSKMELELGKDQAIAKYKLKDSQ